MPEFCSSIYVGREGGGDQVDDVIQLQQLVHALPSRHQADEVLAHLGGGPLYGLADDAVQLGVALGRLLAPLQRPKGLPTSTLPAASVALAVL